MGEAEERLGAEDLPRDLAGPRRVHELDAARQVRVGGKGGDGKRGDCTEAELEPLLVALRDLAPRHAFVTGAPVAATMRRLGYENVSEVPICRHGRIFLTAALGKEGRVLRPSVSFTMEEAMRAKPSGGCVRLSEHLPFEVRWGTKATSSRLRCTVWKSTRVSGA